MGPVTDRPRTNLDDEPAASSAVDPHADPDYQAWLDARAAEAHAKDAAAEGEPACPTCNATDANPSHEVLPHCWKCGHKSEVWPPADHAARRQATALRRIGL